MDEKALTLLQAARCAHVATLRRDRTVFSMLVWVDVEDEHRGRGW